MRNILIFGDSQTWGMKPAVAALDPVFRHEWGDRWPNTFAQELGEGFDIACEALCGRTTAYDDHLAAEIRNGAMILPTLIGTHAPLDLIIIMLGVNDLKRDQAGSASGATRGVSRLVKIIRSHPSITDSQPAEILMVAPPKVRATTNEIYTEIFAGAVPEAARLAGLYKNLAERVGCYYYDANLVAEASPIDGVHLDAMNSRQLGVALAAEVRKIFKEP